jgi:hypothetical protein
VVGDGGADSILQFWLERGDDWMKRYRKMKRSQRVHLDSMRRKCDTTWQHQLGERRYQGGKRVEMIQVGLMRILLGQKINKIHTIDSVITNRG